MKIKKLAYCLLVVVLGGCIPSLHPLYTEDTLVFSDKLLGTWSKEDSTWEFRKAGEKEYDLRVFDDDKEGRFAAHLVQLDNMLFLDICPAKDTLKDMQEFFSLHLVPAHTFMKVKQTEPNLVLSVINVEKVDNMLKDDPNLLKHERMEDRLVLTASSQELQKFLLTYGRSDDMFKDDTELTRRTPLYGKGNLVFSDALLGKWKSEAGDTMEIARQDELTYHVTHVQQDGTRQQCLANLVQVGDNRLLAVFFDESAIEKKGPGDRDLIPDLFVQIGGMEPELLMRAMEYEDVAAMLGSDREPPEGQTPAKDVEPEPFQVFHRL
ncbi:MAG: hypothetical protein ABFD90_11910 [Phycisphaerales bacterium]